MEILDACAVGGGCFGGFAEDAVFEGPSLERGDVVGDRKAGEEVSERRVFSGRVGEEVEPMIFDKWLLVVSDGVVWVQLTP